MDILLLPTDRNIINYSILHLHVSKRNDRLYNSFFNIVKCVYNIVQKVDFKTTKTFVIFDNFIKRNPSSNINSLCPEEIFNIEYMNNYFKKYNIIFMTIPKTKLEILKIEYGLKGISMIDITDKIKEQYISSNDYFCIPDTINLNHLCKKDPAPGFPKKLYLHYKANDKYFLTAEDELNSKLTNKIEVDLIKNITFEKKNIEIIKIEYGIQGKNIIDVTKKIKPYLSFSNSHVTIPKSINLNSLCEDPVFGMPKKLYICYKIDDDILDAIIDEHSSKLAHIFTICLTPKIKTINPRIENFKIEYEEHEKIFIDMTEVKKKYCELSDISFNIKEDLDISNRHNVSITKLNSTIRIRYEINSNHFSIVSENCNLKLDKNLNVNLINEEDNIIKEVNDSSLFNEILNNIKFVNFHEINAINYLKKHIGSTSYSKINVIHFMVDGEVEPFYKINNMTFENYKIELNKKYYSLIDKYLKPCAEEINIILSSEPNNVDLKEYMDFRLFNNVFIDRGCVDPENVQILALLVSKSCNNIFIGNFDSNELPSSVSSSLVSKVISEKSRKILVNLHNIKNSEIQM